MRRGAARHKKAMAQPPRRVERPARPAGPARAYLRRHLARRALDLLQAERRAAAQRAAYGCADRLRRSARPWGRGAAAAGQRQHGGPAAAALSRALQPPSSLLAQAPAWRRCAPVRGGLGGGA
jgi:hypothetical protein